MNKILIIAAILTLGYSAEVCRKFQCAKDGIVDPADSTICARSENGVFMIGKCPKDTFCDMNDKENTTIKCSKAMPRAKLAGEKWVDTPDECFTKKHDDEGYCRGMEYGQSCSNNGDADCDVDLFCSSRKVCEHAGDVGHSCYYNEKCQSHLTCSWNDGVNFVCQQYGFQGVGKEVGPGEEDDACYSNFINSSYYCDSGPKLVGSNIKESTSEKCMYTFSTEEYAKCYYHAQGKAVCKKGPGDLQNDWNKVMLYLRKRPKCHVSIPFAQCDMGRKVVETDEEFREIWMAITRIHWEAQLEGLPECMKLYVHPEAWKYEKKKAFGTTLSAVFAVLLALLGLLLI